MQNNQVLESGSDDKTTLDSNMDEFKFSSTPNLEEIRAAQVEFVRKRNWEHHHSPRNLLLALVGEVGELAELFQWRKDLECNVGLPGWSKEEKEHLGQELSDVLIYLIDLASTCRVDLAQAVMAKMVSNAVKYPAEPQNG